MTTLIIICSCNTRSLDSNWHYWHFVIPNKPNLALLKVVWHVTLFGIFCLAVNDYLYGVKIACQSDVFEHYTTNWCSEFAPNLRLKNVCRDYCHYKRDFRI